MLSSEDCENARWDECSKQTHAWVQETLSKWKLSEDNNNKEEKKDDDSLPCEFIEKNNLFFKKRKKKVGEGARGVVYAARWDNKKVAVKWFKNPNIAQAEKEIFNELKITAKLTGHSNIIEMF